MKNNKHPPSRLHPLHPHRSFSPSMEEGKNRIKKDASLSLNYRPIRLLSNVGKLMEKLVKKTIDRADIKHNIISDLHSGF